MKGEESEKGEGREGKGKGRKRVLSEGRGGKWGEGGRG